MSFRLFGNILGGSVILSILIGAVGSYKEYYLSFVFLGGVIHFLIKISALSHDYKIIHLCDKIVIRIIYAITAVQLIFGVLEGIVQAFVLTMLTATYVSMGIASEDNEQPCLNDSLPIDQKDEKL